MDEGDWEGDIGLEMVGIIDEEGLGGGWEVAVGGLGVGVSEDCEDGRGVF